MAYNSRNLNVLAYTNGFTLWHYTTTDAAAAAGTPGYFNDASEMLRVGDMILANVGIAGRLGGTIFMVNSHTGDTVDVVNLTPVGNC